MYATYPCRVCFSDRICAIGEFIYNTTVHKGQRGVTMATNFGTKIAINALLWEIARMWLLITGGFCGRPIQRRHYWLQVSKGSCHGNQILAKIGQRNHKNGHDFNCKRHIHAEFGFEIGFELSGNSSVTLPYTRERGVTMATNFATKIAINAYKWISTRDSENVISYNRGFSWSTNPKKTFLIARV